MNKSLLIIVAAITFGLHHQLSAQSATAVAVSKDVSPYTFAALPYAYDALEPHIDAQTMEIHYDRHSRAYYNNFVKAMNGHESNGMSLVDIFAKMEAFSVSVRNNGGGYFNHELFWAVMSPEGGGEPTGSLAEAINATFGSFDTFKSQMEAAGATRFGSGWAWLSVSEEGKLFISSTANQDNPLMSVVEERGMPILGIDVWEHAYYLKYQNKRGSYLNAFWNVVNWEEVGRRYDEAIKR